jgi:hypothetical protein
MAEILSEQQAGLALVRLKLRCPEPEPTPDIQSPELGYPKPRKSLTTRAECDLTFGPLEGWKKKET